MRVNRHWTISEGEDVYKRYDPLAVNSPSPSLHHSAKQSSPLLLNDFCFLYIHNNLSICRLTVLPCLRPTLSLMQPIASAISWTITPVVIAGRVVLLQFPIPLLRTSGTVPLVRTKKTTTFGTFIWQTSSLQPRGPLGGS